MKHKNYVKFKSQCPSVRFYWNTVLPIYLDLLSGCFSATLAEQLGERSRGLRRLNYLLFCSLQKKFCQLWSKFQTHYLSRIFHYLSGYCLKIIGCCSQEVSGGPSKSISGQENRRAHTNSSGGNGEQQRSLEKEKVCSHSTLTDLILEAGQGWAWQYQNGR